MSGRKILETFSMGLPEKVRSGSGSVRGTTAAGGKTKYFGKPRSVAHIPLGPDIIKCHWLRSKCD